MNGSDLNAVVKKAKTEHRTVELLEYVLSQTDRYAEPKAYQKLVSMLDKERKLSNGLL
ncbi:hypothetical protein LFYK43_16760 [Ligilactobacillus salitolerans]|uniref:Uncharacterized protein n=1 Tax=Ligilactobacillus salitolerans TaxID=1808352 RepID=A0A401IUQ4_9LACO|nr:hypothetical protein [Ligilactobacillus salitolerans]GBG95217.1 hypothetical protein LFYK43_16760 [Ligilactobacillus salitolerans]